MIFTLEAAIFGPLLGKTVKMTPWTNQGEI